MVFIEEPKDLPEASRFSLPITVDLSLFVMSFREFSLWVPIPFLFGFLYLFLHHVSTATADELACERVKDEGSSAALGAAHGQVESSTAF